MYDGPLSLQVDEEIGGVGRELLQGIGVEYNEVLAGSVDKGLLSLGVGLEAGNEE